MRWTRKRDGDGRNMNTERKKDEEEKKNYEKGDDW